MPTPSGKYESLVVFFHMFLIFVFLMHIIFYADEEQSLCAVRFQKGKTLLWQQFFFKQKNCYILSHIYDQKGLCGGLEGRMTFVKARPFLLSTEGRA